MPRVLFTDISVTGAPLYEAVLDRPAEVPAGYTPVTFLTEWLTLNCRADWCSHVLRQGVIARFASLEDHARALAAFGPKR